MKQINLFLLIIFVSAGALFSRASAQGNPTEMSGDSAAFASSSIEDGFQRAFGMPLSFFEDMGVLDNFARDTESRALKQISEPELVKIYCAQIRYKSGKFFAGLDAMITHLLPANDQLKSLGLELPAFDLHGYKEQARKKIDDVCASDSVQKAMALARDFSDWAAQLKKTISADIRAKAEGQLKARESSLKETFQKEIDSLAAGQKPLIEAKLKQEIEAFVAKKKQAAGKKELNKEILKAEAQNYAQDILAKEKAILQKAVKDKAREIALREKLPDINQALRDLDKKIALSAKQNEKEYEKYRIEAFNLEKEAIVKIMEKDLEQASKTLEEAKDSFVKIDAAKVRENLSQAASEAKKKMEAALTKDSEQLFQSALAGFREKWENERQKLTSEVKIQKTCEIALSQIAAKKSGLAAGLEKIAGILEKCDGAFSEPCLTLRFFAGRLASLRTKFADLRNEIVLIEDQCAKPAEEQAREITALLRKTQNDSVALSLQISALQADKTDISGKTFGEICAQARAQLEAVKNSIWENLLFDKGAKSDLAPAARDLEAQIKNLKNLCVQGFSEENAGVLFDNLAWTKKNGEILFASSLEKKLGFASSRNKKIFCEAAAQQFSIIAAQGVSNIRDLEKIGENCQGKTDARCLKILDSASSIETVVNQTKEALTKIQEMANSCGADDFTPPNQLFVNSAGNIKTLSEAVLKSGRDFLAQIEKTGADPNAVWIEAENPSKYDPRQGNNIFLPEINPFWRPPYFGEGTIFLGQAGDSAVYNFETFAPGIYSVWARDFTDNNYPSQARSFVARFDGKEYGVFAETDDLIADSPQGIFGWHKIGQGIDLKIGKHFLEVEKTTSSAPVILDAFYFTKGAETPPEKNK